MFISSKFLSQCMRIDQIYSWCLSEKLAGICIFKVLVWKFVASACLYLLLANVVVMLVKVHANPVYICICSNVWQNISKKIHLICFMADKGQHCQVINKRRYMSVLEKNKYILQHWNRIHNMNEWITMNKIRNKNVCMGEWIGVWIPKWKNVSYYR